MIRSARNKPKTLETLEKELQDKMKELTIYVKLILFVPWISVNNKLI
jgi:hypothetical protein